MQIFLTIFASFKNYKYETNGSINNAQPKSVRSVPLEFCSLATNGTQESVVKKASET